MIQAPDFLKALKSRGLDFFAGVPDSLLSPLGAALTADPEITHLVAANEGQAVALAAGRYLAAGRPGVVYMQNSGLGNAVNPLLSLAAPEVYALPMVLIIGWRGQPGVKDEPQHQVQGRLTPALLDTLEIGWRVLSAESDPEAELDRVLELGAGRGPAALLVRAGALAPLKYQPEAHPRGRAGTVPFRREEALERLLDHLEPPDRLVATTGLTSRELYELRLKKGQAPDDFLTVGSMGHASGLALAAALSRPERRLICLDGDGALLMHLGALPLIGSLGPPNLVHILLNNQCHESVGGLPTCAASVDFPGLARAAGYRSAASVDGPEELGRVFSALSGQPGPHFLEIILWKGSRGDLGRPGGSPAENGARFAAACRAGCE